ncbi:PREDICTED: autophagy-related protein 8i-like [Populus euphratica]|uniref:Autophagy-related protein n=1 Tax=Populus euphratica TaxID=75702 RepID=A0AAJ6XHE5_POPEU|nr:PREDICTED: autophagy-related protein 8i-like [Populus euphratica]
MTATSLHRTVYSITIARPPPPLSYETIIIFNSTKLSHHQHNKSMGKVKSFKQESTFEHRLGESKNIIVKYPDRVPVIIERYSRTDLPEMEKRKYLVPRDMTIGQFIHILSSRLELTPGKALFIFVKNTLPQTASQMDLIYESYKDDDGFLYMCYSSEKTFG